jgi:hypothetical protein
MNLRCRSGLAVISASLLYAGWQRTVPLKTVVPTVINLNIGAKYEDVVRSSSYPITKHTAIVHDIPLDVGGSFVEEPAVILHFTDPQHGFELPPTKFAAIGYWHNQVTTVSTSPMLDTLPFHEAVALLEILQNQFKRGGWEPWEGDESEWFDLSPTGTQRLYERMFEPGYAETTELRVPGKYAMTFRLKCTQGCWTREPPYRFLIDIGVGEDGFSWWDKLSPEEKERELPPPQYRKCNGFKAKDGMELEPVRPPMPPCKPSSAAAKQP